ncbi:hypothetical protein BME24068_03534 [Burkholderia metallica]|nr:hypothetical protein BME24068_03534 [Burkholderia metallica]
MPPALLAPTIGAFALGITEFDFHRLERSLRAI